MKDVILFRYLDEPMLEEILRISEVEQFEPESKVIAEGEEDSCLYVVLAGSVTVSVREQSGKDVYICTLGEGDVFGEAGMFVKSKRTASVSTVIETVLLKLSRQEFIRFIKSQPAAGIKMLMIIIYSLLRKLREANQELAFERKTHFDQEDVDSFIDEIMRQ
ncbi:MAG: cyclic nucleotide-binding domain-containing protein [Spirochaetales bacterium]|nr:cyclic nucleotide-binding domain-containing protein [Spirochaetales bacterium]